MFSLPTEPTNFADVLARRKQSARNTLRETSADEIRKLVTELYPDGTHPLVEVFSKFIDEHRSERIFRGETSDGIGFVYYPKSNNGIWYRYTGNLASVGRLGPNGLKALSEIMAETGRA
ncbi:MAG: hypothetical protein WAM44_02840 [Chthoniobacterales bacterium]